MIPINKQHETLLALEWSVLVLKKKLVLKGAF
jgi:hypothetical protein